MEKIGEELQIKRRGRHRKNIQELSQVLETSETQIPNRKVFNINEIADINPWDEQIINLKKVKSNKNWENYIEINGRKYYEFNWEWIPKDSMYIYKWNSLFIWDKFEWLTNRDWVSFKYSNSIWGNIDFEQVKTKYDAQWIMHLKQIYKSESFSASEVIAIIKRSWKIIKITKDLIDKYLSWSLNKTTKATVEAAIRLDPKVFAYIQELKE